MLLLLVAWGLVVYLQVVIPTGKRESLTVSPSFVCVWGNPNLLVGKFMLEQVEQ